MRDQLAKGLIGGVVLYPDNISSTRQLRLLTAYLANANSTLVPFIAVDQEGGRVQRLDRRDRPCALPFGARRWGAMRR